MLFKKICPSELFVLLFVFSGVVYSMGVHRETAWLSGLDLSKMTVGWGQAEADKSIEGKPIRLNGKEYDKGVGSHADSVMYLDLHKGSSRFKAFVGVDDEVNKAGGSVRFRVYGDGKKLFDSGVVKAGEPAKEINLDTRGVGRFVLMADAAGDNIHYDHADWAMARFEVVGRRPEAVDGPVEELVILTPKPAKSPRMNGPSVYGARPGRPFIYRIPATGVRPMRFSCSNLPKGLLLDPDTGILTGTTPQYKGEYKLELAAANRYGKDSREFTVIVGDTLALTPPMGWNSWYIHYNRVSDKDMRAAADAMIESGMADYGYQYVNIDDCWSKKKGDEPYRDEQGCIIANEKFPDMKALTDYIHGKGLKAGIYTSPGPWNCGGYTGSYGHELADAMTFAEWGYDFLKYDWCSYGSIAKDRSLEEFKKPYMKMGQILKGLDRDIVFNLCQYGMGKVWEWGGDVGGNCWRTTGDLGLMSGYLEVGSSNAEHYEHAKPGQWNDPDYILIGWVGSAHKMGEGQKVTLTGNEQYSYMSMWSLMAAPLIFSGDMTKLDDFTLNVLCNAEVIEVDQDPAGIQGRIVEKTEDHFIMIKELSDGSVAAGLFNTDEFPREITLDMSKYGLNGSYKVRDLWRQKDVGNFKGAFSSEVLRHGVTMVRFFRVK